MLELVNGAMVAFSLKVVAAGLAFTLHVLLARLLGAEDAGLFFLAYTVSFVASAIGRIGMENSLVRFVATGIASSRPGNVKAVYGKAIFYSFLASLVVSVALYFSSAWLSIVVFSKPDLMVPLKILSFSVVPFALMTLHASALQGMKWVASSVFILSVLSPMFSCVFVLVFVPGYGVDAAAFAHVLAVTFSLFVGIYIWRRSIEPYHAAPTTFKNKVLFGSSMPLFVGVVMNMIITWLPTLMIGVWENSENIAIYSAATKTAMLTSFVLVAVNSVSAPKFAALYQSGNVVELNKVARQAVLLSVVLSSPILFLFIALPDLVLSIFGKEFVGGVQILIILAIGQFVNVCTGSVGILLMMSGHERLMRNNLIFCAVLAFFLNAFLIPWYGMLGGAISVSIVLSVQNIIALVLVRKNLKIRMLGVF